MTLEAKAGVMWPRGKERLEPPEPGRGKRKDPSLHLWGEHGPADTLILDSWPRGPREWISVV